MNCTGDQTVCLTLNGTWNGGKSFWPSGAIWVMGLPLTCANECRGSLVGGALVLLLFSESLTKAVA